MGSSYTKFRGKGFWSRGYLIQIWLRFLSLQLGSDSYLPGWRQELRDELLLQSGIPFLGCVSASLDRHLVDDEKVDAILEASERTLQCLRPLGPTIPAAVLEAAGIEGMDVPIDQIELIAGHFIALLRGELDTDEYTSPVLPSTVPTTGRSAPD